MIESRRDGVAFASATTEGVVAGHLVQDRRPVADPGCKIALGDQHDEPRRSPRD